MASQMHRRARGALPALSQKLAAKGLRERLVKVENAPGNPFDFGRFEIVQEPFEPF